MRNYTRVNYSTNIYQSDFMEIHLIHTKISELDNMK